MKTENKNPNIIEFTVNNRELQASRMFSGTDESRLVLCSVLIEVSEKEVLLVSTNGRSLAIIRSKEQPPLGVKEPVELIIPERLMELLTVYEMRTETDEDGDETIYTPSLPIGIAFDKETKSIALKIQGAEISGKALDAVYPDWRKVLPTIKEGATQNIGMDMQWLNAFGKAQEILGGGGLIFKMTGATDPIEIRFSRDSDFYGVLMPYKIKDQLSWPRPFSEA